MRTISDVKKDLELLEARQLEERTMAELLSAGLVFEITNQNTGQTHSTANRIGADGLYSRLLAACKDHHKSIKDDISEIERRLCAGREEG